MLFTVEYFALVHFDLLFECMKNVITEREMFNIQTKGSAFKIESFVINTSEIYLHAMIKQKVNSDCLQIVQIEFNYLEIVESF
jgi:hypothetical protein